MKTVIAYLKLARPANIITAIADILAGFAISGSVIEIIDKGNGWFYIPEVEKLSWLVLSTIGLYGGGIVFNDVFDASLDKKERPERPIPSGKATIQGASLFGSLLLVLGVSAAAQASFTSMFIAANVAFLALFYDAFGKHFKVLGPINMGLCRGGNLLLGVSAIIASVPQYLFIAIIPVLFIAAITMISRGEVHGGNLKVLKAAVGMYMLVISSILWLAFKAPNPFWQVLPFIILFAFMVFPPLLKAIKIKQPKFIGKAVKAGVISLIIMDAALAVGFSGWAYGLLILLLLPISIIVAKGFAVT